MTPKPRGNPLTRKLGPLPAWAWLGAIVTAYLGYRLYRTGREQPDVGPLSLPQVRAAPSTAMEAPASAGGGSGGIPGLPSDLLAQFFANQMATIDALTGALIATPAAAAAPVEQGAPQGAAATGPAAAPSPVEVTAGGWTGLVDPVFGVPISAGFGGFGAEGQWVDETTYATSAFLPPPTIEPQPAVQPPVVVDLYTADNQMQNEAVAAAGGPKQSKAIAY